ncbi:hypothetical protein, partial [Burkholderia multivorans]|uniref:hypothetical protein n=1 Tax=Burkholderia multivorans TaxID=87883 RepID=UPI00286FDAF3
ASRARAATAAVATVSAAAARDAAIPRRKRARAACEPPTHPIDRRIRAGFFSSRPAFHDTKKSFVS